MVSQTVGPFEDLRATILAACEVARARGIQIGDEDGWGVEYVAPGTYPEQMRGFWARQGDRGCCCPLGALILARKPEVPAGRTAESLDDLCEAAGVDPEWGEAFMKGFDGGAQRSETWRLFPAWELGREMRARYVERG
jgi:hypothetical protein